MQGTQRGAAAGFKLDTLLKLADVKGTDRKTSLLHFVIAQVGWVCGAGTSPSTAAGAGGRAQTGSGVLHGSAESLQSATVACPFKPRMCFTSAQFIGLQLVEEDEGMKGMSAQLAHIKQAANMQASRSSAASVVGRHLLLRPLNAGMASHVPMPITVAVALPGGAPVGGRAADHHLSSRPCIHPCRHL